MRAISYGFPFLLLLVFGTASFADESKPELNIGAIFPLTGPTARIGSINRVGALFASELINETGGRNGASKRFLRGIGRTACTRRVPTWRARSLQCAGCRP